MRIPKSFQLAETLDCGQAFRWAETEGLWRGIALNTPLTIAENGEELELSCSEAHFERHWKHYFDLDTDYEQIKQELSSFSPAMKDAAAYAPGIRVLRQDGWEALCSFIISQNNNIPRIKGIVERLCALLGADLGCGHAFPTPQALAACTVEDLAPIRSGFRAKYLLSAANLVTQEKIHLEDIPQMPLAEARQELMQILGVGPKVADCALLYGFHRLECFPMDVWMKRAMETLFPGMTAEDFGPNAGIAQQYIFHYSRMNPRLFSN